MEQINRIKMVMLCHFSNSEVRQHLPLGKRRIYNMIRRFLSKQHINIVQGDIAPWDTALINFFKGREDLELHVISAYSGLKKRVVSFEHDGVHYSFVRNDSTMMLKRFISSVNLLLKLNPMTRTIRKFVDEIHPDIVVLVGLENTDYSASVLGMKDYPVFGLCQTIYNNPERSQYSTIDKSGATIEREIIQQHRYFGVLCSKHFELLNSIKPSATVFKYGFPSEGKLLQPSPKQKVFDFVNFALSLDLRKGAHDSIRAIALLKEKYPTISLNLVGRTNSAQRKELETLVEELGVQDNVVFTPFFEKQSDMFQHIQQARFAVLPCKLDHVSGTMAQAMELGLPIVVYKTSGTPSLNRNKRCALIAEKGNIEELAQLMGLLMESPALAEELRTNAREYRESEISDAKRNGERLVNNFHAIIDNFRSHIPIPQAQLFNPEIDN